MDSFPCLDAILLVYDQTSQIRPNIYTHRAIQNQIQRQIKLKSKCGEKTAYVISRGKKKITLHFILRYNIDLCNSFIMTFVIQQ